MKTLKVGNVIAFDNGLVKSNNATITIVSEKTVSEKINGEKIRYIVETEGGYTHICNPSEVTRVVKEA